MTFEQRSRSPGTLKMRIWLLRRLPQRLLPLHLWNAARSMHAYRPLHTMQIKLTFSRGQGHGIDIYNDEKIMHCLIGLWWDSGETSCGQWPKSENVNNTNWETWPWSSVKVTKYENGSNLCISETTNGRVTKLALKVSLNQALLKIFHFMTWDQGQGHSVNYNLEFCWLMDYCWYLRDHYHDINGIWQVKCMHKDFFMVSRWK